MAEEKKCINFCTKINCFCGDKEIQQALRFVEKRCWRPSEFYFRRLFPYLFICCCYRAMYHGSKFEFPGRMFIPKISIPHFIIFWYSFLLLQYSYALYRQYQRRSKNEENYSLIDILNQGDYPVFWKLNLKVYLKNLMIFSYVYFVSKIKEFDGEVDCFRGCFFSCFAMHNILYCINLIYIPTTKTLPDIFKYVPSLPSAALFCYSMYRCISSDELWQLAQEEVGLFANNTLLLLMFLYEDFCLKNFEGRQSINFVNKSEIFPQLFNESKEDNSSRKRMMKPYMSPLCTLTFLFLNFLFAERYFIQTADKIYLAYVIPAAIILFKALKVNRKHFNENTLTYLQIICCFSLHTEVFPFTLTSFMNVLSAPLFLATVALFIRQIALDISHRRVTWLASFYRTLSHSLTFRKPSKDWMWIVESLTFVKNIEKFDVHIAYDGSVALEPKVDEEETKTAGKCAAESPKRKETITLKEEEREIKSYKGSNENLDGNPDKAEKMC